MALAPLTSTAMRTDLLATPAGRRMLFAMLYLSEGAPIGFIWWALPTLLRQQGFDLAAITTLTALATVPWVLKFLVAPIIDFGIYKGVPVKPWILLCQLGMALCLLPLALLDWSASFALFTAAIVCHAVFAAAQDVGIDTLAVRTVPIDELGRVNGWMQAGMLLGRAGVAAGATLLLGASGARTPGLLALIALIAIPAIVLAIAAVEPSLERDKPAPGALRRALTDRATFSGLAVALLAGAGFEFFGVSVGPRLVDAGQAPEALALFYGLLAPAGLVAGALSGGVLVDRVGTVIGTMGALALVTVFTTFIALTHWWPELDTFPTAVYTATYFAIGALTASSYALFMSLSHGTFAATRISLFMAMTNACEVWSAFIGGRLAATGYGPALLTLTAAALLAGVPLYALHRESRQQLPAQQLEG